MNHELKQTEMEEECYLKVLLEDNYILNQDRYEVEYICVAEQLMLYSERACYVAALFSSSFLLERVEKPHVC